MVKKNDNIFVWSYLEDYKNNLMDNFENMKKQNDDLTTHD